MTIPEETSAHPRPDEGARHGRLTARPVYGVGASEPGTYRLDGQALLRVPEGAGEERARLAVVLHGAGGTAEQALEWLAPAADLSGALLLAPQALASTWDMIVGGYGADVARLDAALKEVFAREWVDVDGVAVAGFSDGASYALSLGVANGDLFRNVLAFSPGFMAPMVRHGSARFFVAHGTRDAVLPVDACSRRIVPALSAAGYEVSYTEFDGGHEVPAGIAAQAVAWWFDAPDQD
ncbi:alpha/beta hydrolase [Bailinhaonella thermotolerans]|uniref:alpha/beta hydrolase n=1 Tax=Bailinhaonella thermotolerans TaxID=1070861 RepID=UPI00192A367C|nr:hypothetical protein [Bailinhaonella thermotolerans]